MTTAYDELSRKSMIAELVHLDEKVQQLSALNATLLATVYRQASEVDALRQRVLLAEAASDDD